MQTVGVEIDFYDTETFKFIERVVDFLKCRP